MNCIAFLDLLGTKTTALTSVDDYTKKIDLFSKKLETVAQIYPSVLIYAYSDNAYIEAPSFDIMQKAFMLLRRELFINGHYFNAAIHTGSLDADLYALSKLDADKKSHMRFVSKDAIAVYTEQLAYKGIGISVSNEIAINKPNATVISYYCKSLDPFDVERYYDILVIDVSESLIQRTLGDYIFIKYKNQKASRYYIAYVCTLIQSIDKHCFDNENAFRNIFHLLSFQYSGLKQFKQDFKNEIFLFVILLLQRAYEKGSANSIEYRVDKTCSLLSECDIKIMDLISCLNSNVYEKALNPAFSDLLLRTLLNHKIINEDT